MNKNKKNICKYVAIFLLASISIFNTACWNILELNNASVVVGLGADLDEESLSFTAQLAIPTTPDEGSAEKSFEVVSETGETLSEAARKITLHIPRHPIWAHSSTFIIGENLAKTDVSLLADTIGRNVNIRKNEQMFVSVGSTPQEVYSVKMPLEEYSATGLAKMIKTQDQSIGIYTPVRMTEFLVKLATVGIQPILPQVIIAGEEGNEKLLIDGTAVFKERKMVGSLNEVESRGYRFLRPQGAGTGLMVLDNPPGGRGKVTLELIRASTDRKVLIRDNKVLVKLDIEGEMNFYDIVGSTEELLTPSKLKELEKLASEMIKSEIESCIRKAQELESDIFGWGVELGRVHPKTWDKVRDEWVDIFPEVESEVSVKMNIRRSYLQDRTFQINE